MNRIYKFLIMSVLLYGCNFMSPKDESSYLIEYRQENSREEQLDQYMKDISEGEVLFFKSSPVTDRDGDSIFIPLTLKTFLNVCDSIQPFTWVILLEEDYERLSYKWVSDTEINFRIFNPDSEQGLDLIWTFFEDGRNQMITSNSF